MSGRRFDTRPRRALRHASAALAALAASLVLVVVAPAERAAAAEGLDVASDTTFELRPQAGVVHVHASYGLDNVKADTREGTVTRRYYYDGLDVLVAAGATAIAATSDGRALTLQEHEPRDLVKSISVRFDRLYFNQQRTIDVDYDVPADKPRSDGIVRINDAYGSFLAFGIGDAGRVDVHVVVPDSFEIETFGSDVTSRHEGATDVYDALAIEDPDNWYLLVSARLDGSLVRNDLDVGGRALSIRSWPGDDEWETFVADQLDRGLPELEKLTGQRWPRTRPLEVIESASPYLRGYGGWFQPEQNRIEVGEELDQRLLLHELSHAWFNSDFMASRWIDEGMAEEYSSRAVSDLGGSLADPDAVERASSVAVALEDWTTPAHRDSAKEVETYGYNASWFVIRQLVDEIGQAGMEQVIDAAQRNVVAYAGTDPAEKTSVVRDWRRFLDLVEELGGSTRASELFTTYVLTDEQRRQLDDRGVARTAYRDLAREGGERAVPDGIRTAMETWKFAEAMAMIPHAKAALVAHAELEQAGSAAGLRLPTTFDGGYQRAQTPDDLDELAAADKTRLDAVHAIASATVRLDRARTRLERLGLWDRPDPAGELASARAELERDSPAAAVASAARAVAQLDGAQRVGRARAEVLAGACAGALLTVSGVGGLVGRRRRRRRRRAAAGAADAPTGPPLPTLPPLPAPPPLPIAPRLSPVPPLPLALPAPPAPMASAPSGSSAGPLAPFPAPSPPGVLPPPQPRSRPEPSASPLHLPPPHALPALPPSPED